MLLAAWQMALWSLLAISLALRQHAALFIIINTKYLGHERQSF